MTPKVSDNRAAGWSFMAPPVVKQFTSIKTSALICAETREVFGGYHIGVQKNCNWISRNPSMLIWALAEISPWGIVTIVIDPERCSGL